MSLATKLVTLRKEKGLTQMDLAERLNVSRQAISRWEVGAAVPSTDNLKVLGELYGVQVDYLLNDNAEGDSKSSEMSQTNLTDQQDARKRNKYKVFVVCTLAIVLAITVLIFTSMTQSQEQDLIVPIEDMYTGTEEDYFEGTFMFE